MQFGETLLEQPLYVDLVEDDHPEQQPKEIPSQVEAQVLQSKEIDTSISYKLQHATDGVTKEMEMALRAKTDAKVALNVLKDRMQRMEKHPMVAKEQVELYLKRAKEQIAHVTAPLFNKIKEVKEQIKKQKKQLDHKDKIKMQ